MDVLLKLIGNIYQNTSLNVSQKQMKLLSIWFTTREQRRNQLGSRRKESAPLIKQEMN